MLLHAAHETEHRHHIAHAAGRTVAGLNQALAEVNAAAIQARRRAGFQAALRQLQLFQPCAQRHGRRIPCPARGVIVQPHMDLAVQESTRRQHHGLGLETDTHLGHGTHHPVTLHHQVIHRLLEQPQVGLVLQRAAHGGLVQNAVGLGAGGAHGRAFAGIQNPELDARLVGGQRHHAAQRVHLFDQVAFANAADAGVAAHLAQGLDVVGQQQSLAAHAGRGQGSLGSGVAAADNDDVEFLGIEHGVHSGAQGRSACAQCGIGRDFTGCLVFWHVVRVRWLGCCCGGSVGLHVLLRVPRPSASSLTSAKRTAQPISRYASLAPK